MLEKFEKINRFLLTAFVVGAILALLIPTSVFAQECESNGAYGQNCVYNKSFEIDKDVRIKGESTWNDKITDVSLDDIIEFRIRIENVGDIEVDDMKMEDFLPSELERTGGSGLTEYWNDFEPDETQSFTIEARIRPSEFDRSDNFEKCVVNKVEVEYDGAYEGSDTATVCYGEGDITELPKTGPASTQLLTVLGLVSTGFGLTLKRK